MTTPLRGSENRGTSGSARRKIMTSASINAPKNLKEGTPKSRNVAASGAHTQQIPEPLSALDSKPSRVKSSRNSHSKPSVPAGGPQPRAVTPKQSNKLFQSIKSNSVSKNNGDNQIRQSGKLNMTMNQRMAAIGGNDYMMKNNMNKISGHTQQLGGISNHLTHSSKMIPKKE